MILEPTIASPAIARAYCDELLTAAGRAAHRADARLVVSELVTNAVVHARTAMELSLLLRDDVLRVELTDFASDVPQVWARDESGRGLPIVEALTRAWGVIELGSAKTVWCELGV